MQTSAVVATAYGGPEVLELIDVPLDEPGHDQVLVDVAAAGTNPVDFKLYSGRLGSDASKLPMRLGLEAAGVVRSVDGELAGPSGLIRPGDEVIVYPGSGCYAGAILAPASSIVAKPSTLTMEEASGLLLTGVTAVHALTAAGVATGDTVVVHGAAGGVGLMAVQLAVASGARVIATAGAAQHDLLAGFGAEPVTYGEGLLDRIRALAPRGVDAAIDLVGTDEAADVSLELVKDRGRLVTIVGSGKAARSGFKVLGFGGDPGTEIRSAARLALFRRAEAGTLRVVVEGSYPLAEAAAAHRELIAGHTHGKIVLVP